MKPGNVMLIDGLLKIVDFGEGAYIKPNGKYPMKGNLLNFSAKKKHDKKTVFVFVFLYFQFFYLISMYRTSNPKRSPSRARGLCRGQPPSGGDGPGSEREQQRGGTEAAEEGGLARSQEGASWLREARSCV